MYVDCVPPVGKYHALLRDLEQASYIWGHYFNTIADIPFTSQYFLTLKNLMKYVIQNSLLEILMQRILRRSISYGLEKSKFYYLPFNRDCVDLRWRRWWQLTQLLLLKRNTYKYCYLIEYLFHGFTRFIRWKHLEWI